MKNIIKKAEKKLKLKNNNKFKFLKELVLIFLVTGKFVNANEDSKLEVNVQNLEKKIQKLRQENRKRLKYSRLELERLEKEGDQVIKSPWNSYIFSILGIYNHSTKKDKEYFYGMNNHITAKDRNRIDSGNLITGVKSATSGWITGKNDIFYKNFIEYEEFEDKIETLKKVEIDMPKEMGEMNVSDVGIKNTNVGTIFVNKPNVKQVNPIKVDELNVQSVITPDVNISVTSSILPTITKPDKINLSIKIPTSKTVSTVNVTTPVIPTVNINITKPIPPKITPPREILLNEKYIQELNPNPDIKVDILGLTSSGAEPMINTFSKDTISYWGQTWYDPRTYMFQSIKLSPGDYWSVIEADGTQSAGWSGTALSSEANGADNRETDVAHNIIIITAIVPAIFSGTIDNPINLSAKNLRKDINPNDIIIFMLTSLQSQNVGENVNLYLGGNTIGSYFASEPGMGNRYIDIKFKGNFYVNGENNKIVVNEGRGPMGYYHIWHDRGIEKDKLEILSNIISEGKNNYALTYFVDPNSTSGGSNTGNSHIPNSISTIMSGKVDMYGENNIGARILGYTPNKYKYSTSVSSPVLDMQNLNLNGDNSTGIMFGKKTDYITAKADIGVYQGKTKLKINIGNQLGINQNDLEQSIAGNGRDLDPKKVENGVGVYVESGQRLGMPLFTDTSSGYTPWLVNDPIQNLLIDEFDIKFGKYAKDGIMFLVKNGSEVDITETRNDFNNLGAGYVVNTDTYSDGTSTEYSDGLISVYSEGYYKTTTLIETPSMLKQTTVNVARDLELYSTNATAYYSKESGIINVGNIATPRYTNIHNYNGIGAYIDGTDTITGLQKGRINIYGNITAEAITPSGSVYENKGLVAISNKLGTEGTGGEINLVGDLKIKGIGAYVNGSNSKIILKGNNTLTVGKDLSAFTALNGGSITVNNTSTTNITNNENSTVVYAGKDSYIDFEGSQLDITTSKGTVLYGDVRGLSVGTTTVNLTGNDVTIGIKTNNTTPVSLTTGVSSLFPITLVDNGYRYTFGLDGGIVNIDSDLNIGSNSVIDKNFKKMIAERVMFNINSNVTSTDGKGLAITNNSKAGELLGVGNEVKEAGFNLSGGKELNVTGGTSSVSAYGLYTNYGKTVIDINGKVTVDQGVGVYGVNGSIIENRGVVTTLNDGSIGLLGTTHELATDGTAIDHKTNTDVLENFGEETVLINNKGKVTVKDNSIAIKAINSRPNQTINDIKIINEPLTDSDMIEIGVNSIGIHIDGLGEIIHSGKIKTGDNSIGILSKTYGTMLTLDNSTFSLGNKAIGIDVVGTQELSSGKTLDFLSNTGKNTSDYGMGIIFEGKKGLDKFTNNGIINVGAISDTSNLIGIYGKELAGGTGEAPSIENKNTINVYGKKIGIYAEGINVVTKNLSTIEVLGEGGIGIYGKLGSEITNESGATLTLSGKNGIGIYSEGMNSKIVNNGSLTTLSGEGTVAIYGRDKTLVVNNSEIILQDTTLNAQKDNLKVGIFLEDTVLDNTNKGMLTIGKDNIGIYAKNSKIIHDGTSGQKILSNSDGAIGIYGESSGTGNYEIELNGSVEVNGDNAIGVYGTSGTGQESKIKLNDNIKVTAPTTKKAVGVYVKGDNVEVFGNHQTTHKIDLTTSGSIGLYVDGESKVNGTYNINLVDGSIGAYFTNKGSMTGGTLNISGNGTTDYLIGLAYKENSSNIIEHSGSLNLTSGASRVIMLYSEGTIFSPSTESIKLGTTGNNNIGVYLSDGLDGTTQYTSNYATTGTITGTGTNNYGMYAVGGSTGSYAGGSMSGSGVVSGISSGLGTTVTTTGDIIVTGEKSIGLYSELDGKVVVSTGKIISNTSSILDKGIGIVTNGGKVENNGEISSQYIGIYGADKQDSSLVNHTSIITQNTGTIHATRDGESSAGVSEARSGVIGIYAKDNTQVNLNGKYTFNGKDKSVGIYLDEKSKLVSGINGEIKLDYTSGGSIADDKWAVGAYYDNGTSSKENTAKISSTSANTILLYSKGGELINKSDMEVSGKNATGIYGNNSAIKNEKIINISEKGIGVRLLSGSFNNQSTGKILLNKEESIGIYAGKDSSSGLHSTVTNIGKIEGTGSNNGAKSIGVYVSGGNVAAQTYEFGISGGIATYLADTTNYSGSEIIKITGDSASSNKRTIGLYVDKKISNPTIGTNLEIISKQGIGIYMASDTTNTSKLTHTGNIKMSSINDDEKYSVGVYLAKGVNSGNKTAYTTTGNIIIEGKNNIGFYVDENASFTTAGNVEINSDDAILAYIKGDYTIGQITTTGTSGVNIVVDGGVLTNGLGSTLKIGTSGLQVIGQSTGGQAINQGILESTSDFAVGLSGIYETGSPLLINGATGVINLTGTKSVGIYAEDGVINVGNSISIGAGGVGVYAEKNTHTSTLNVNSLVLKVGDEYIDSSQVLNKSVGIYAKDTDITYTGIQNIEVGKGGIGLYQINGTSTNSLQGNIEGKDESIGIFSENILMGTVSADIKVGNSYFDTSNSSNDKYSIGIYAKNGTTLTHTGKMLVGNGGIGYYASDNTVLTVRPEIGSRINGTLFLSKDGSTITGDVVNLLTSGELEITGNNSIGLMADNGILDISSTAINKLKLLDDSVGIYVINNGILTGTVSNIEVGRGSTGIYDTTTSTHETNVLLNGENSTGVRIDSGSTTFSGDILSTFNNSIGIYAKTGVTLGTVTTSNTKQIVLTGDNSTGIAAIGDTTINNNSKIIVGNNNSIGIYAKDINAGAVISSTNDITVGTSGAGIYVTGTTGDISNAGNISTGTESYGIYGQGINEINNSGDITIGEKGTGIANINVSSIKTSGVLSTTGKDSTLIFAKRDRQGLTVIENNGILDISNVRGQSVGIYTLSENGGVIESRNKNTIKVGESDFDNDRYSIGMYTNGIGSKSVNEAGGIIEVSKTYGIGMYGINGAEVINNGTIAVTGENAYGIYIEGIGTKGINTGTINVSGTGATGITLFKGASLINSGVINLTGTGSVGIYTDNESVNNITNPSGTPIKNSSDNMTNIINAGVINITGDKVTLNGVELTNHKVINIDGTLDITGPNNFILNTAGKGSITTGSITGEGTIGLTPDGTYGGTSLSYLVQSLNTSLLGNFEIYSLSPSFIAKILPSQTGGYDFYLIKVPYAEMLKNTEAIEFGKGLDKIYLGAKGREIDMFDGLNSITDKTKLAETFDTQLRGNVYANIQQRMMNVNGVLDTAYKQLKREENTTKDVTKVSAIYSGGDISDKNPGVEEYDYQSLGIMYLKEKETLKYGRNFNYSLGILQSKFDFDQGSKEDITSLKAGIGYEQYLKQGSRFKYMTRGEAGINYHDMERKIYLDNGTYKNNGDYISGTLEWKNKLNYELPIISKNFKMNIFGSLNTGYGKYQGFKEDGDGMHLDIKSEDYFSLRPGAGVEGEWSHPTSKGSKFMLTVGTIYEYETQDIYEDGNEVKIANTDAGYYRLEVPNKVDNIFKVNVGLGYETSGGFKTGVRLEREEGSVKGTKYQLDFSWKF